MTRVKVCGLTTADDADLAVAAGASAIGLIFWTGSPRAVQPAVARRIVDALPPFVQAIGVFVNASPAEVDDVSELVGCSAVQLHGDERADAWMRCARPIIKALSLDQYANSPWLDKARAILLDAHDPDRRGGTGRTIDWPRARRLSADRSIVLAGGLTSDNVAEAIATVRPVALDVASGVEREPGRKDPVKLRAFFEAVRRADDALQRQADESRETL